jgi:hypothetical protein
MVKVGLLGRFFHQEKALGILKGEIKQGIWHKVSYLCP